MSEATSASLYDYPHYYDLVYGSDWKAELDFLSECFERHAGREVLRVFEPACGTGRLLYRLAKEGLEVSGLDLNEASIDYCNERLARHGFARSALVGDMSAFQLKRKVDAAFNMINSFRHLATQKQAEDHLRCVAAALRKGGLYVLGLHLLPTRGAAGDSESWSARRGHLAVCSSVWTIDCDPRRRREIVGMSYDVYTPTQQFRLQSEMEFRTYTAPQFTALVESIEDFEVAAIHDFHYRVDRQVRLGPTTEDVVFVLRKR